MAAHRLRVPASLLVLRNSSPTGSQAGSSTAMHSPQDHLPASSNSTNSLNKLSRSLLVLLLATLVLPRLSLPEVERTLLPP